MIRHHSIKSVRGLAVWCRGMIRRNQSPLIVVVGDAGVGKSSFVILFGDLVEDGGFDPGEQMTRTPEEWKAVRRTLAPGKVVVGDEIIAQGGNRTTATRRESVDLVEDTNTGRKLGHIRILILPFMDDLSPKVMKHAHWLLKLGPQGRGVAKEVQKRGLKKVVLWFQPRFKFTYADCAKVRPDLWEKYMAPAMAKEKGRGDSAILFNERLARLRVLARSVGQEAKQEA